MQNETNTSAMNNEAKTKAALQMAMNQFIAAAMDLGFEPEKCQRLMCSRQGMDLMMEIAKKSL